MTGEIEEKIHPGKGINYYVIAVITIGILIFLIGNSIEPEVEDELDFYELMTSLGFASVTIFAFFMAKRYWGSRIFGKTYLALALGFLCYSIGWNLWWYIVIYGLDSNPYFNYPDIFFIAYYPLIIYHIRQNSNYFKRSISGKQKLIIVIIPITITSMYAFFGLFQISADGGLATIQISAYSNYDEEFFKEFFLGFGYIFATSLTFGLAIIAAQIFRTTVLGAAWGLLLLGIMLNTFADIFYYYVELFGGYVRQDPVTGIWLAGTVFLCYGLYLHRKEI